MYLKIMSGEHSDCHILLDNVISVQFEHVLSMPCGDDVPLCERGKAVEHAVAHVVFSDRPGATIPLKGAAYVLNEYGRTVDSFNAVRRSPARRAHRPREE